MTLTRLLLVLAAALVLVHGAPKKRCCQPSPDCNDPCPTAEGDLQSDQTPAADGALYSDPQQGGAMVGDPQQQGAMYDQQQQPGAMFNDPQLQQGAMFNDPQQQPGAMFNDQQQQQGAMLNDPQQQQGAMLNDPQQQPDPNAMLSDPQQQGGPVQVEGVMEDCCQPGPSCNNPCQDGMASPVGQPMPPPMAPPMPAPMPPQMGMAPPMMGAPMGGECCQPAMQPSCQNPCQPPAPPQKVAYAPYPGEITFKLMQTWSDKYLDNTSPAFQILSGNVANAIKAVLGPMTTTSNIYFREGYVPGNPSTMPKTVAHVMVNGGSDDASRLQMAVTPDNSLGDGLKVYKDSFNAY